jgi:hypothetical protein
MKNPDKNEERSMQKTKDLTVEEKMIRATVRQGGGDGGSR